MKTGTKIELTYQQKELIKSAEKHDWAYPMALKLSGGIENQGNNVLISEAQFKKLLKIFA
jgi:hypothetical protein